jgi:hypothetical protein
MKFMIALPMLEEVNPDVVSSDINCGMFSEDPKTRNFSSDLVSPRL